MFLQPMFLHPYVHTPLYSYTPVFLHPYTPTNPCEPCSYTLMFLHCYVPNYLHPYVPTLLFICRPPISCFPFFWQKLLHKSQIAFLLKDIMFSVALVCFVSVSKITLEKSYERIAMNSMEGFRVVP